MSTEKRGTTVEVSYESACRNYTLGFALSLFMASSLFSAFVIGDFVFGPDMKRAATILYGVFGVLGALTVALAYHYPVLFHEVMEE